MGSNTAIKLIITINPMKKRMNRLIFGQAPFGCDSTFIADPSLGRKAGGTKNPPPEFRGLLPHASFPARPRKSPQARGFYFRGFVTIPSQRLGLGRFYAESIIP